MAKQVKRSPKGKPAPKLLKVVSDHPVAAAGIAGAAIVGAVLVHRAAKTAATVVTVKAAGKAAKDVTRAMRS